MCSLTWASQWPSPVRCWSWQEGEGGAAWGHAESEGVGGDPLIRPQAARVPEPALLTLETWWSSRVVSHWRSSAFPILPQVPAFRAERLPSRGKLQLLSWLGVGGTQHLPHTGSSTGTPWISPRGDPLEWQLGANYLRQGPFSPPASSRCRASPESPCTCASVTTPAHGWGAWGSCHSCGVWPLPGPAGCLWAHTHPGPIPLRTEAAQFPLLSDTWLGSRFLSPDGTTWLTSKHDSFLISFATIYLMVWWAKEIPGPYL